MERCLYYILGNKQSKRMAQENSIGRIEQQLEMKDSDKTWDQKDNKNLCQKKTGFHIHDDLSACSASPSILVLAFSEAIEGYNES